MTVKTSLKTYLKEHEEHLVQQVSIAHPGDFPRGVEPGDALKAFESEQEKICWCWWPRAQVGSYVTYPKEQDSPADDKLRALFKTAFTDKYSKDWE